VTRATLQRRSRAGTVDVIVVGAGHAGLAMSCFLSQSSIDHVIFERGEIANTWRRERWDSLRLLTPNWQSRLPGYSYTGDDPNGYMTVPEVIRFIDTYARLTSAPVRTGTTVMSVTAAEEGYYVVTNRGDWRCRALVIASGAHNVPVVPSINAGLPKSLQTLTPKEYRNPEQLDDRGVLVVGASATGVQLADEIHRSGRHVTLAIGEHIRMPRVYRALDIQSWLDAVGILDERYDEVDDIVRARRVPSPQLVGTPERATLDLNALARRGVELVGRLVGIQDGKAQFSGSLRNNCTLADLKLRRLLDRIDTWADQVTPRLAVSEPERFEATSVADSPRLSLDLAREKVGTVIWACGFRPDYSWLHVPPALDRKKLLRHDGGIVAVPGLYVLGLNFMRRRKSSFMHGVEDDVRDLGAHLVAHLGDAASERELRAIG
jgi:putative flavoprotein involved in K+ transport